MAKQQEVLSLAKAALDRDRERVISTCKRIVANEPNNSSLRHNLERMLDRVPAQAPPEDLLPKELGGFVSYETPKLPLESVVLPEKVRSELERVLGELEYAEVIRAAGLTTPHKFLLSGPPGNGKTTLAGAIAAKLDRPFFVIDFTTVVASFMGETGARIAKILRGLADRECVIFLDEMETLLSERAGQQNSTDVGEAKRIVSTLLLEIDRLPDNVIFIGATNHEEMLDRAVMRRFDKHWDLPHPGIKATNEWLRLFANRYADIPIMAEMDSAFMCKDSFGEMERDVQAWCRQWIVQQKREG